MARSTPLRSSTGFTLVELAISLMVIGLLIGGVLKGQELIVNARVTSTMRQINAYKTAVTVFKDSYDAYPGDIKNPGARVPNCTGSCSTFVGNGNGALDPYPVNAGIGTANAVDVRNYNQTGDRRNFFLHLAKAGLITGIETTGATSSPFQWGAEYPEAPFSNSGFTPCSVTEYNTPYTFDAPIAVCWIATNATQGSASGRATAQIDIKMDDGKPFQGDFVVMANGTSATTGCVTNQTAAGEYSHANSASGCQAVIRMP